jgi:hypothetical protein
MAVLPRSQTRDLWFDRAALNPRLKWPAHQEGNWNEDQWDKFGDRRTPVAADFLAHTGPL